MVEFRGRTAAVATKMARYFRRVRSDELSSVKQYLPGWVEVEALSQKTEQRQSVSYWVER